MVTCSARSFPSSALRIASARTARSSSSTRSASRLEGHRRVRSELLQLDQRPAAREIHHLSVAGLLEQRQRPHQGRRKLRGGRRTHQLALRGIQPSGRAELRGGVAGLGLAGEFLDAQLPLRLGVAALGLLEVGAQLLLADGEAEPDRVVEGVAQQPLLPHHRGVAKLRELLAGLRVLLEPASPRLLGGELAHHQRLQLVDDVHPDRHEAEILHPHHLVADPRQHHALRIRLLAGLLGRRLLRLLAGESRQQDEQARQPGRSLFRRLHP